MPPVSVANGAAPAAETSIDLPLFDISHESAELGREIVQAAAKHGFLWISGSPSSSSKDGNHGNGDYSSYDLDAAMVQNVFDIGSRFFRGASGAEKAACKITKNRGFVDMHVENLDPKGHKRGDFKQCFNLQEPDPETGAWRQPMPPQFSEPAAETALRDFHARCRAIAARILRLIALGLDIQDPDWFLRSHDDPHKSPYTVRMLYYPQLPPGTDYRAEADIRAGAHSDYGSITLLFTRPGQPGLEILQDDGTWARVPVSPPGYHDPDFPPIVVNMGDLLQFWTNGLLKSTVHRVVLVEEEQPEDSNSGATSTSVHGSDRYSIAVFVQPADETVLVPVPSQAVAERAAAFQKAEIGRGGGTVTAESLSQVTAGEHLLGRLRATYGIAVTG
ncbi:uncharacterized protein Z520_03441 [Fonsecaea multimorphosa CBS 102226]|uniref:Fe2OG dioxygenase domain-containing protein n=1 Tax=Fonsecaea multimorphosa CBS 102226 TaxID=1442371 RepID=A0A0D2HFT3_9EURO|nr:uncharacterized protein Z520_03441 [Fonsecaea multimorphosa CBS 102226]KIY00776.1 hypothetical protein Z520_03441 [Fonsecaea multimorphosa CBS 102226]OAL27874.1 hypothetical protein AYO22_03219 [Fonsecaea multimorphosa]